MNISATISNSLQKNDITVSTEGNEKQIDIPGKSTGYGSSVNGGELLFLALATCFCNDLYREASRRKIEIDSLEVKVTGEFGKEGESGSNIVYTAIVNAPGSTSEEIDRLIHDVDQVAEIHNTLRKGVAVSLKQS